MDWIPNQPLKDDFKNLTQIYTGKKDSNFLELHRVIMNLKLWLRGIHHNITDLQAYLDEYCYGFNRSFMKEYILGNHLKKMVNASVNIVKI